MNERSQEQTKHSVCRMCHSACDLLVTLRDNEVTSIIGDKRNPAYHGFTCIKGRESGTVHTLPSRLLRSQKRQIDGSYRPIPHEQATAEIAAKLREIVDAHGPRSVALYAGTFGALIPSAWVMGKSLMQAIGSPLFFTSSSIDQPGKFVAPSYMGRWLAGPLPAKDWDAVLIVGGNPIVSISGMVADPARYLKKGVDRGMQLVVVDPRRSDTAKKAAVHLQCRPREDVSILAGIIRCLLAEDMIDHEFVAAETVGLEMLRSAVDSFTPDYVARRAGITAESLVAAARVLGHAKGGIVSCGTGPNMAGHGTLVEYLGRVIATLRGWWLRADMEKTNPGVLIEGMPPIAGTPGPEPVRFGTQFRTRGLTETAVGPPTAALPDEILTPGPEQIRALIVVGGNPMLAFPDQVKTGEAMKALDLLVCLDARMAETSRLAHYVLAPKLGLEVENNSAVAEILGSVNHAMEYQMPYAHVTPPLLDPPEGAEVCEEWESLYAIARHMGLEPSITPYSILDPQRAAAMATKLDMTQKPSTVEFMRMAFKGSPVPYDEVRNSPEGKVYPRKALVQPKPADWTARLELAASEMMTELAQVASESLSSHDATPAYPLRLLNLRLRGVYNSSWRENPRQQSKQRPYNLLLIHPQDLAELGIDSGDVVEITSPRAKILGVAEGCVDVRPGCVSMSHGWGTNPDEPDDAWRGGCTSRLVANDVDFDPLTGIPRMSAIPVRVAPAR